MVLEIRALEAVSTGESVDLVLEVIDIREGFVIAREMWFNTSCRVHEVLDKGVWTLYGYLAVVTGDIILEPSATSRRFKKPQDSGAGPLHLKEICSGIGGFSLGAAETGFRTLAFLDRCGIACDTVKANGGHVISADIAHRDARVALHEVSPETSCLVTAGFPCQPFSRQGDSRGFLDERAHTLSHVLVATWFLQPEGLVLECVTEAEQHPFVRALLAELAEKFNWRQNHMVLELADVWPCRRLRWWCILVPESCFRFSAWPRAEVKLCIRDILGEWPTWSQEEIAQLRWDEAEASHFLDPAFGPDPRVLDLCGIAPTALHSWGSQLRACPCKCRGPLSQQRLRTAGLRGFGVPLGDLGTFRHPHPQEVGLLNGVSVKYVHLADLRAALCLVGQVASPLQACWVFAQVRRSREAAKGLTPLTEPIQVLHALQTRLVHERKDHWHLPSMNTPRWISIQQDATCQQVKVTGAVQVKEIVQAERQLQGPGQTLALFEGARRLSDIALLHACPAGEYQLLSNAKRQRRAEVPCDILVCGPAGVTEVRCKQGALPCQVLAEAGLPPGAQLRFAGTQAEVPKANRLHGRHILDARQLRLLPCDPDEVTDVGITGFLRALTGVLPQGHAVLTPCTASLIRCLHDAGGLGGMSGIRLPQARYVHIIAEDSHHWFLLSIDVQEGLATHWDPLPERARAAAGSLCAIFGGLFGQPSLEFRQRHLESLGQHCCGAIALCHLMCTTGLLPTGSIGLVLGPGQSSSTLHWPSTA